MNRRALVTAAHAFIGMLLLAGIWIGLPARWWLVDVIGTGVAFAALGSALGLFLHKPWALWLARSVAWLELVVGSLCVTLLAFSGAQLAGSYGPVGNGGAVLMATIGFLVVPYLIVLPALQLAWLREAP